MHIAVVSMTPKMLNDIVQALSQKVLNFEVSNQVVMAPEMKCWGVSAASVATVSEGKEL